MSEDIYVYESIDIEPAVTEAEVESKIAAGEYQKVTWEEDGRIGDGYFVKVGAQGMIGIAMIPEVDENGDLLHRGAAVQANPLDVDHRDTTIEAELRKIVNDFGTAPDGTARRFERAIFIQKGDIEDKVSVEGGQVVRALVKPSQDEADEPLYNLAVTKYEADLLRQMVALDIHDHKAGDVPVDSQDSGFGQRRIADCQALLAKLNDLLD